MRPTTIICLSILTLLPSTASTTDVVLPEKCRLVPVKGPCKAMIEAAYFDPKQGKCVTYFYDGCGAVKPFDNLEECQQTCEQPKLAPKKRASSGLYYDPVEDDPNYAEVFSKIDAETKAALDLPAKRGGRGYVHIFWGTKKRILKQKYKIDWRTPAELNPWVIFD